MSLAGLEYDKCYMEADDKRRMGPIKKIIYPPGAEHERRCSIRTDLDLGQRVTVDSHLRNLSIMAGRCDRNQYNPRCGKPPCGDADELRKLTGMETYSSPYACPPYHAAAFRNNVPKPKAALTAFGSKQFPH